MRIPFLVQAAALVLLVAGCAPEPPPPLPPTMIDVAVAVAPDANPDPSGQGMPVGIYVYELASADKFNQADYFQLTDQTDATLGADLINKQQIMATPGSTQAINKEVKPETRFLGVVVGYRDIDRAVWRAIVPVPPNQTTKVTVNVAPLAVTAQ